MTTANYLFKCDKQWTHHIEGWFRPANVLRLRELLYNACQRFRQASLPHTLWELRSVKQQPRPLSHFTSTECLGERKKKNKLCISLSLLLLYSVLTTQIFFFLLLIGFINVLNSFPTQPHITHALLWFAFLCLQYEPKIAYNCNIQM